jgi:hypothetical protein
MKRAIAYLILSCFSSTLAAEGVFVSGSFAKDKVQTKSNTREINIQDKDFYAFRSGIEQNNARYYVEYAHSNLRDSLKVDVLSLNADYLHHVDDKLVLIAGSQLAVVSSSVMEDNSSEGWGVGARFASQVHLTSRAKIETGYQVTRTYDLYAKKQQEKKSIDAIRGVYIAFEFNID